jgi:hypothetical protein
MNIVRRNFHEAGKSYSYELEDGTKLHSDYWIGKGFRLKERDIDVLYVPIENPVPLDSYGEPDYYDVIGFDKKHM